MSRKYTASFADVTIGKAATYGFREKSFKTLKEFANQCLKQASVPVRLKNGKRDYDHVIKIHNWLRFDCDEEGEKETITSILSTAGISHISVPSTNYHIKHKAYKWHIHVPTRKAAQDVMAYKWQVRKAFAQLGITLHDKRVSEVCVQNCNPYRNGKEPEKGAKYVEVFEGTKLVLEKAPVSAVYTPMIKTVYKGEGSSEVINKEVVKAHGNVEVLSPNSGIKIKDVGWVRLKDLALEPGGIIGGLSCPGHNNRHKGGFDSPGYAFATMNEGGDVSITCTGAECKGKWYKMEQEDFGALTKLSDLFEIRRLVSVCGYDFKGGSFLMVKGGAGQVVYFREKELEKYFGEQLFFKLLRKYNDEESDEKKLAEGVIEDEKVSIQETKDSIKSGEYIKISGPEKDKILDKKAALAKAATEAKKVLEELDAKRDKRIVREALGEKAANAFFAKYETIDDYMATIVYSVKEYLKMYRQFSALSYEIDPFINETVGRIDHEGTFIITGNLLAKDYLAVGKPNPSYVEDYKKHNPYLDDILEMIVAQRFGADPKNSYLWVQAASDWGKSFLFEGVLSALAFNVSVDEIKSADKGQPSGLEPLTAVRSSFLFVDEFGSAVKELKKITNQMSITPKGRRKVIVPIYMKIFTSAETVSSLQNDQGGVEEQFRNRFLKITATGSLRDRKLYTDDKKAYFNSVQAYALDKLDELQQEYLALGRVEAAREADRRFTGYIDKYTIKNGTESLDDNLPEQFRVWIMMKQASEHQIEAVLPTFYKDAIIFKEEEVYIYNMSKAVQLFVEDFVIPSSRGMVLHKTAISVIGAKNIKRSSVRVNKIRHNARKYLI